MGRGWRALGWRRRNIALNPDQSVPTHAVKRSPAYRIQGYNLER